MEIAVSRQLALPLEPSAEPESALRNAWSRTRMRVPYDVAIHNPALAICLRNIAAAETRRRIQKRRTNRVRVYPEMQRWTWEEADPGEPLFSN
jgi:hypothetical protein